MSFPHAACMCVPAEDNGVRVAERCKSNVLLETEPRASASTVSNLRPVAPSLKYVLPVIFFCYILSKNLTFQSTFNVSTNYKN